MPKLIILIGLPGSGKSTYAAEHMSEHSVHISSDAIRAELYGDESIQTNPAQVFDLMYKRTIAALNDGNDVFYDATNMRRNYRLEIIKRARRISNVSVKCVIFGIDINTCISRDSQRSRTVGKNVILQMERSFQMPLEDEYDDLEIVHKGRLDLVKLLNQYCNFDQKNPHHTLTLGEHSIRAAIPFDTEDENQTDFYFAGLFHDLGKIFTQTFDANNVAHYYNHESVSAYMMCCGLGADCAKAIQLVSYHMYPYMHEWKHKGIPEDFYHDLMIFHKADKSAH